MRKKGSGGARIGAGRKKLNKTMLHTSIDKDYLLLLILQLLARDIAISLQQRKVTSLTKVLLEISDSRLHTQGTKVLKCT